MTLPASRARTVFRACVVNAIREGEGLMEQLVGAAKTALAEQEAAGRDVVQRNLVADALRLLTQHEAQMVKAYPLALLEAFADGPSQPRARPAGQDSGIDFGELALMDEADVLAQVELSRAQQVALHATDAALSELNTLVSSAQGLASVQPERNPLRPDNYIRALQQVVSDVGVAGEVRQLWMAQMRELLGAQLVGVYQRAAQGLREHGVQPVGYAVAGGAGAVRGRGPGQPPGGGAHAGMEGHVHSLHGGMGSHHGSHYGSQYGSHYGTHYGTQGAAGSGWGQPSGGMPLAAHAEEALLTVNMLQQMLAGVGDPYRWSAGGGPVQAAAGHGPAAYVPPEAAGALEDLAQLERLVGRLAGGQGTATGWHTGAAPVTAPAPVVAQPDPEQAALGVVSRMMDNIARDTRLLPPVQRAVQSLAPALKELVRYDTAFFADEQHPARRLLDELTQRSLAFEREDSPGFSRFMRLVTEVVGHLATARIDSAAPFERVLRALEKAWEAQERHRRERREAKQREARERERRALLAERLASDFRRLEGAGEAPPDLVAFVTGPWAQVVAWAQTSEDAAAQEDASAYLGLVPLLLTCAQDEALQADAGAVARALDAALPQVRRGLQGIGQADEAVARIAARLQELQRQALEREREQREQDAPPAEAEAPVAGEPPPTPQPVQEVFTESAAGQLAEAPAAETAQRAPAALPLALGCWVEVASQQGAVRRQLTWVSPNRTLFLFTGADGSSQSMTRRMIDKLTSEGAFRLLEPGAEAAPANRR